MRTNTYIGHEWVLERTQRLLDASRELRMAAADHVEELMGALKDAAKKKLEAP